jgi:two-component system, cell cycle sensor histidine kinase and response regulator CckA
LITQKQKKSPALDRVLQRLAFLRMFVPLVALSIMAIGGVGYFNEQTLEREQLQRAKFMARVVDRYLDQAARTLDAVTRMVEIAPSESLSVMQGTWEAYGYFDTFYYLDASSKIRLLAPQDPRYLGLDMSNFPYFKRTDEKKNLIISRPFISLRTGDPTVYLVRQLSSGEQMVGELSLGSLQDEITHGRSAPGQGLVYILDQYGMLLAHPSFNLVKQQTNQGFLEIFRRGLGGSATLVYEYAGAMVLGSAARVDRAGWVVVDQVPLSDSFNSHAWTLGLTLLASLVIWLVLTWHVRRQLQQQVVTPLVQVSHGISSLANGDFGRGKALASLPIAFAELTALAKDFQHMSDALATRQAALQESEERYRSLFEQMPVALYRYTVAGKCLDVNLACVRMFGYPDREALVRISAADLYLNPEDRERWQAIAERDGIVRDLVLQLQRYDGTVFWVRNTGQAVRDNAGQVMYYEGSLEDITERKQAEESIRKLSQAIEQSPVSIVITDIKGSIEFVNAKFTQVTGYSAAEAMGQNPRIMKSGETTTEEYRQLWKTIGSGKVWQGVFHNRKKSGELFWEYATIAPVRNSENVITHYLAVKEDITERKKLEENFHQAQKMESVGRLAGGVAHDFNNMLSVILGHTELALDNMAPNDPLYDDLKAILNAAKRSTDITQQLLAFARKQTIAPKVIDLNETIEGMVKMLRRLIGEDIDLAWLPGTVIWPVRMDPSQIDQVLANLCVNARDAIAGVGKLTIETGTTTFDTAYCADHAGSTPGNYVLLTVSDDGCGMDRQTLDKLFEPFFTTKDVGKGTGLGLATVYGIVKQNQGFINVYSEPGQGTTFRIYFPAHETVKTQTVPEQIAAIPRAQGKETILLVEDEPTILQMTTLMLERLGYTVLAANTPGEALDLARQHAGGINLLMTDVVMPEMNGRDLATNLQSFNPSLRSLFMSGYTANVIAHHGVLDEGVHFLQKPFSKKDLAIALCQALKEEKSHQL